MGVPAFAPTPVGLWCSFSQSGGGGCVAYLAAGNVNADGSSLAPQMDGTPPGTAALREMPGSIRSNTSGIGACLPWDGRHIISGIYVTGLDRDVGESTCLKEFARFGEITKLSCPRGNNGKLLGCAMIEYRAPGVAASAVYGLHGWHIGNRDLKVKRGDREILISRNRSRGCPRVGRDVWESED